jgi:hypothetical protein
MLKYNPDAYAMVRVETNHGKEHHITFAKIPHN